MNGEDSRAHNIDTAEGLEELDLYLNWLRDNRLADSESSFVDYAVLRGDFASPYHLYVAIRFLITGSKTPPPTSRSDLYQYRMFWVAPDKKRPISKHNANWFDWLQPAYKIADQVSASDYTYMPGFRNLANHADLADLEKD